MRNLDAGEIVDQVYLARRLLAEVDPGRRLTNIVYMGMGEPLHNYDNLIKSLRILTHDKGAEARRSVAITVSTSGLVPKLERLGAETVRPNLAVSLNAPNDAIRDEIMPINRKWNIAQAARRAARRIRSSSAAGSRSSTCCSPASTTRSRDAAQLAKLLRGVQCKVNIIPWNPHPEAPYARPAPAVIDAFQNECKRLGLPTYLRTPRGDDIDAACGQLANRAKSVDGSSPIVPLRIRERPAPPAVE